MKNKVAQQATVIRMVRRMVRIGTGQDNYPHYTRFRLTGSGNFYTFDTGIRF